MTGGTLLKGRGAKQGQAVAKAQGVAAPLPRAKAAGQSPGGPLVGGQWLARRISLTRKTIWGVIAALLLWGPWLAVLAGAMRTAGALSGYYPGVSLRYNQGLSSQQALAVRRAAVQSNETSLWPTYWSEVNETLEGELGTVKAPVLYFDGDAAQVYPADFTAGSYPGEFENGGAAVSTQLAWQLWGGADVLGRQFILNDTLYTVGGVFESDSPLALVNLAGYAPEGGWKALELSGELGDDARTAASDFIQAADLPTPDGIVAGSSFALLSGFAVALPVLAVALFGLVSLLRWWRPKARTAQIALFAAGLLFALALPSLLSLLPGWVLPSQWSDFSHWTGLWSQGIAHLKEYLLLNPAAKDGAARLLALKQLGLLGAGLVLSALLCSRLGHAVSRATEK